MNSVFIGIALFLFHSVSGNPSGAPEAVCTSMTPSPIFHGLRQSGASPFQVTVNKHYYMAGEPVQVTISGTGLFKGILVQAREVGKDTPIGTFSNSLPSGVKHLTCSNEKDSVTHMVKLSLKTITLTWLAPTDVSTMGNISFFATVVKERVIFWVKLESPELYKMEVMNAMTTEDAMARYVTTTTQSTSAHEAMMIMPMSMMYATTHMSMDGGQMSTYSMVDTSMTIYATKSTHVVKQSSRANMTLLKTANPPTSSAYAFSPILSPLLFYAVFLLLV